LGVAVICSTQNRLYVVFLLAANNPYIPQLEKICGYPYTRQYRKCCILGKVADRVNCSKKSSAPT